MPHSGAVTSPGTGIRKRNRGRSRLAPLGAGQPQFPMGSLSPQALASSHFCPAFPLTARLRSASVASKSGAAPSRFAARRRTRRCIATGSSASRTASRAQPGSAARPPPRTGRPAEESGRNPGHLVFPPRLFIPRQLRHLRQMRAQLRVPLFQHGQKFVADAVAGKRQVPVGRIFAPGLLQLGQIRFNLRPGSGQQRPEDATLRKLHHGMNPCKSLRPRTPQKFRQARSRPGHPGCGQWQPRPPHPTPLVRETTGIAGAGPPLRWFRQSSWSRDLGGRQQPCPQPLRGTARGDAAPVRGKTPDPRRLLRRAAHGEDERREAPGPIPCCAPPALAAAPPNQPRRRDRPQSGGPA